MGKRYVGLLALSQRKMCFRALSIFSSLVCFQYMNASAAFFPTLPFIQTASSVLRGAAVSDVAKSNYQPIWEFLGFKDADAMLSNLRDQHMSVEEGIEKRVASVEGLAGIPDGFLTPNGLLSGGKLNKAAKLASNASQNNNAPTSLMASLSSPITPNLAKPLAAAEGDSTNLGGTCQPGTPCKNANDIADKFASSLEDSNSASIAGYSVNGASTQVPATLGSSRTPSSVATFNPIPHNGYQTPKLMESGVRNDFSLPPAPVPISGTSPIQDSTAISQFMNVNSREILNNPSLFEVMPAGWFSEKQVQTFTVNGKEVETEVVVRGALDKPFNSEKPNDVDNFLQVLLEKDVGDLKAGVYTIKKTDTSTEDQYSCSKTKCTRKPNYARFHKKFKDYFVNIWKQKQGKAPRERIKRPALPGEVEALSEFQLALDSKDSMSAFNRASLDFTREFKRAVETEVKQGEIQKVENRSKDSSFDGYLNSGEGGVDYYIQQMAGIKEA